MNQSKIMLFYLNCYKKNKKAPKKNPGLFFEEKKV